jgi:hypothetical protein
VIGWPAETCNYCGGFGFSSACLCAFGSCLPVLAAVQKLAQIAEMKDLMWHSSF